MFGRRLALVTGHQTEAFVERELLQLVGFSGHDEYLTSMARPPTKRPAAPNTIKRNIQITAAKSKPKAPLQKHAAARARQDNAAHSNAVITHFQA